MISELKSLQSTEEGEEGEALLNEALKELAFSNRVLSNKKRPNDDHQRNQTPDLGHSMNAEEEENDR